jgi:hypothetical protein
MAVTDEGNNRVLIWNRVPTCTGSPCVITTPADAVLGQRDAASAVIDADPATGLAGTVNAKGLNGPWGLRFVGPNRLIVVDLFNRRVLFYDAQ